MLGYHSQTYPIRSTPYRVALRLGDLAHAGHVSEATTLSHDGSSAVSIGQTQLLEIIDHMVEKRWREDHGLPELRRC
jgi:hypothetical protein